VLSNHMSRPTFKKQFFGCFCFSCFFHCENNLKEKLVAKKKDKSGGRKEKPFLAVFVFFAYF